ncbi:MAG: alkaline phosphatase family protein [Actinobacteria bacterium]|nr:alkaline phosphatase family protein [Actinomycetota bacterium]
MTRPNLTQSRSLVVIAFALAVIVVASSLLGLFDDAEPVPSFKAQACSLPDAWLERIQRGYFEHHSGQVSILPRTPAYMASGAGGWSHSGPWPYLVDIPLVFYGPGLISGLGDVETPATLADVAPTLMTLLHGFYRTEGDALAEVAEFTGRSLKQDIPKLVVVVVLDGGGWNVLNQWPDDWPNLARLMRDGVSFTNATVGSSPSVTPAVHTTLGTGEFPRTHGITGIPVRDEEGTVVDSFLKGESSRLIQVATLAERWDAQNRQKAKIAMVGYEPWHLGMIGKGAETPGADKDDAVWLDVETNEWITNPAHYRLPPSIAATGGLDDYVRELDAADGDLDGEWLGNDMLDQRDRAEETPAFIQYHTDAMLNMIEAEGYGDDAITDFVFTNYKQIDRLGHYFNMTSEEVRGALVETDRQLGVIERFLDEEVGRGRYALVVTADHGQQPDAADIGGFGIDPREVEADLDEEFGPITRAVWPTEVFLLEDEMAERDVTVEEVAQFLGRYRLADNTQRPDMVVGGAGELDPGTRLFDMAIPARMLPSLRCVGDGP